MKSFILILNSCLTLVILTACGAGSSSDEDDSGVSSNAGSAVLRNCGSAMESDPATEPERTSIENLFGCVTLTETLSNGDVSTDSVVFTAASEGEPVAGGRSVNGMIGRNPVICAEVRFSFADFSCATSFINTITFYLLTMESQYEGAGTAQLCFSGGECGLDGAEFPENPATISISRGAVLIADGSTLNGESISDLEASDHKLADAYQFVNAPVNRKLQQNQYHLDVMSELENAVRLLEQ